MLVTELMTQFAHTVESSMAMSEAAELMRDHNVGMLPVLEGERLTGMLTDRDLVVRGLAEGKDPELTTIREIMTPRVATVFDDQDIDEAMRVMRDNQVRRVVVISHDRRMLGVLSEADLPKNAMSPPVSAESSQDIPTTLNTPSGD